jgi:hypothetical protein
MFWTANVRNETQIACANLPLHRERYYMKRVSSAGRIDQYWRNESTRLTSWLAFNPPPHNMNNLFWMISWIRPVICFAGLTPLPSYKRGCSPHVITPKFKRKEKYDTTVKWSLNCITHETQSYASSLFAITF